MECDKLRTVKYTEGCVINVRWSVQNGVWKIKDGKVYRMECDKCRVVKCSERIKSGTYRLHLPLVLFGVNISLWFYIPCFSGFHKDFLRLNSWLTQHHGLSLCVYCTGSFFLNIKHWPNIICFFVWKIAPNKRNYQDKLVRVFILKDQRFLRLHMGLRILWNL